MTLKRCTTTFIAFFDGAPHPVHEGDIVDDGDDLYKASPRSFVELKATKSRHPRSRGVEQATAAPNELRGPVVPEQIQRRGPGRPPKNRGGE